MKISPARISAYKTLFRIEKESAFSSVLLSLNADDLEKKDRSLCHEIVLGTLRKKLYLDKIIENLTKKKISKFDLEVITSLRIGIYQLLFLDKIPAYSAINESVNIVKFAKKKSASGLVNAVLRKVSKSGISLSFDGEIDKISIETSHPRWLIERWTKDFGSDKAREIAQANNLPSKMSFRFTRKFYGENLSKQKDITNFIEKNATNSEIVENSFIIDTFNEDFKELSQKGFIYFQDEGSQLISNVVDLKVGENFFDVCASPGSKTTLIAKDFDKKDKNNLIVAGDLYEHRIKSLYENCLNQNVGFVDIVQYDATKAIPFKEESFDAVLLDAPCSGTGTLRNNPEIRYNLCESDISILSNKQLAILQNASKTIKQKGRLIYSTCSLETEENEYVVKSFLDMNKDFEVVRPNISEQFLTSDLFARTFPHRDNIDGFFIAILAKRR